METVVSKRESPKEELRRVEFEFFRTVGTLIVSAFSLVAALAWNTAITKTLERYLALKSDAGVTSWMVYALTVTAIAVLVTVYVGRWAERFKRAEMVEEKDPAKK